ncbi:MAG: hypothetical protein O9318_10360 [Hylemonella sp.]|uniref:hypothetical protein n=1 Tax=Hylemonella sp. TaxID=2066020 RepID=UPI0022CB0497|nr:hypothetical protein [Hylemonella sp.]MCZ8252862.1 hypothetical protein [Hylemonella sp.]
MVRLDNLFAKKPAAKTAPPQDAGPTPITTDDEQALDRKSQRLERRELLYAVVRESMARVGMLSSSYKYKVLSLDSRGKQYLIMMDLPREMAEHIGQLAEIEEVITQNARQRHHIEVTAVYWRINQLAKVVTSVLRKPRPEAELGAAPPVLNRVHSEAEVMAQPAVLSGERKPRFEPIRPDEVHAFKQGLGTVKKPTPAAKPTPDFAPTEFPSTEFEETRLEEENDRLPLSRTQYGDLI